MPCIWVLPPGNGTFSKVCRGRETRAPNNVKYTLLADMSSFQNQMHIKQFLINLFDKKHFLRIWGFLTDLSTAFSENLAVFSATARKHASQAARRRVCCMHLFITIVTERQIKNNIKESRTGIKSLKQHLVTLWLLRLAPPRPEWTGMELDGAERDHFETESLSWNNLFSSSL